jgi:hypothetical protein
MISYSPKPTPPQDQILASAYKSGTFPEVEGSTSTYSPSSLVVIYFINKAEALLIFSVVYCLVSSSAG